ncbi:iron-containing alcohol dehydrogenase [Henriciella marina]|uniref:Iron-containing alcohol dehydrogenase n=1 Tax=Henriciella marina TaxID=453851 RepID=A0ABT4LQ08_9PROT|nr:iron-containing alcohol dehydrogenase [Henriciella marina]MCZ4296442.1 iron-containing alcohol dehydrogenase [Henriciella marina]
MIRPRTFHNLDLARVHIGIPAHEAALLEADTRQASRIVVVAPKVIVDQTPIVTPIIEALGDKCAGLFTDLVDHVPRSAVIALADYLRETKADLVVTIGGGTPMDTVKVALICLAENIAAANEIGRAAVSVDANGNRVVPDVADPPFRQIVIPTTLSGAEFSDLAGCVDTETQVKQLFTSPKIGSASVILDPALCVHTPDQLWFSTGVRAIDHAVESICSSSPEPLADAGALHALRLFGQSLQRTKEEPHNLEARLDCQTAVWLACTGLNRTPYGASHGIGHQLGAVANVPHGLTSCVMLPHVMRYNARATEERQAWIADAMGAPDKPASEIVAELIASLGMPTTLRDVGVKEEHFDAIADGAMLNAFVRANVRPLERKDIISLLERAY